MHIAFHRDGPDGVTSPSVCSDRHAAIRSRPRADHRWLSAVRLCDDRTRMGHHVLPILGAVEGQIDVRLEVLKHAAGVVALPVELVRLGDLVFRLVAAVAAAVQHR